MIVEQNEGAVPWPAVAPSGKESLTNAPFELNISNITKTSNFFDEATNPTRQLIKPSGRENLAF